MSFVRIGTFQAKPEKIDELLSVFEREVYPAMRAAPGNVSACLLHQHDAHGTFLACTAWETRAQAEQYERSGLAQENVERIRHTLAGPPSLRTYDGFGG
jgi:quinol monooxygenase YgiN